METNFKVGDKVVHVIQGYGKDVTRSYFGTIKRFSDEKRSAFVELVNQRHNITKEKACLIESLRLIEPANVQS